MANYSDLIGQERIAEYLKAAVRNGKVSHAYIFDGIGHGQKLKAAEIFATALLCEQQTGDPCGSCRSCRQAAGKNQPDLIYVTHEKPQTLAVAEIREQVNASVVIRPYSSRYKVYIIDDAHLMNDSAQNALLKTLEEPPAYAVIILLTENEDAFLPTIRSRCVSMHFRPVADEKIRTYLMEKKQVPDYQADLCAAFAQGNVGKAVRLAGSEQFRELKEKTVRLMNRLQELHVYELADELADLGDPKEYAQEFLELLSYWMRDVLVCKSTGTLGQLIFSDAHREVDKWARRLTYAGAEQCLEEIRTAQNRIRANGNAALVLEMLLLNMKKEDNDSVLLKE